MENWPTAALVALAGGLGGVILGLAARLGRFCTLAAIEDAMFGRDYRRLRMWALAMAVAITGVALAIEANLLNPSSSLYHRLPLNPVSWIVGGLFFGIGMAFCGTCAYGTLARVGGGDLRALFVFLVLGISAYMAIAGPTAALRDTVLTPLAIDPGIANSTNILPTRTFNHLLNLGQPLWLPLALALLLAAWSISDLSFRRSSRHVLWSLAAGLVIVSGWLATSLLGADPFDPQPLMSHTYSVPLGQTLIFFMTMSSASLTFGIGATLGVIAGALAGALIRREFRWEAADDAREMRRHLLGAFLMGTGGVYAGGCTIGQGLSAASVLAISAPFVLVSIWCGVWLGLTYLMEGSLSGAIRGLRGK
jgi:uncharacterized membrane protein YedE/YeeE